MLGLQFQSATPVVRSDPARADIACFVGAVGCRAPARELRGRLERVLAELGWRRTRDSVPLPDGDRVLPANVLPSGDSANSFSRWLDETLHWKADPSATAGVDLFRRAAAGLFGEALAEWWTDNAWLAPFSKRTAADLLELSDVPVPVDTWDGFDALFAWDERPLDATRNVDTAIGAAVRRFFLQGGRKCYVVRVCDPWSPLAASAARIGARTRVFNPSPQPVPVDRTTWHGIAHLFGLPDVSFLCVPDLPELFAHEVGPVTQALDVEGPEHFVECTSQPAARTSRPLRAFPAPRCDAGGFAEWAGFVRSIGTLLRQYCIEVQFVGALPLLVDETSLATEPGIAAEPAGERRRTIARLIAAARGAQRQSAGSIQTAFVQLAYPWLRTLESSRLPGELEPPDGMLAGILASNALTAGTWRSAGHRLVPGIVDVEPVLSAGELQEELPYGDDDAQRRLSRTFQERISTFVPTAAGFELVSDVTTDDDEWYRPANVNRLTASIIRAARVIGEDAVFTNNGEALWRHLRTSLEELLLGLWGDGALAGASAAEAFDVRCDRSTMTQADSDAGRVIVRVEFTSASPIEQIVVAFAMDEGGQVTLIPRQAAEPAGTRS